MKKRLGLTNALEKRGKSFCKDYQLIGPAITKSPGRPALLMLNANPFNYGIANLGMQCIVKYLLERDVNVHFTFADTLDKYIFGSEDSQIQTYDVIGVSIPFEDTFLSALRMLDQIGLPIHASQRNDDMPLVVAGGMAMINPMPISDFVDIVVIGEGREALYQIMERYFYARQRGITKRDALTQMVDIPGVYIPSHYIVEMDDNGYVSRFEYLNGNSVVESLPPLDLNQYPINSVWTSPQACYGHDNYFSIMVAMGCYKKCPFCVVGQTQGAKSGQAINIDVQNIVEMALERRTTYGTNLVKIFFSSAFSSNTDYADSGNLKELLHALHMNGFSCRVGSLNIRQADEDLFELLSLVGQKEVAFAPETTERLRPMLGKAYITDDKLKELAYYASKYKLSLNVYSLGALPGETDSDTIIYAALLRSLQHILNKKSRLIVHYNPVFMKAQTPFQYFGCVRPLEIRRKYRLLRAELEDENIEFVSIIPDPLTYYQPVLALGDANTGKVLAHLHRKRHYSENDWMSAFIELGLDDSRYFTNKNPQMTLPWEHISFTGHQRLKRIATAIQNSSRNYETMDEIDG